MALQVCGWLWLGWGAVWLLSSLGARRDERSESVLQRWLHLAVVGASFALVFRITRFDLQLYDGALNWLGTALCAAGLTFAVWARIHLGSYWSGRITLKEGHQVIRSGPYAWVRHPIYTGFIGGFFGAALASGTIGSLLAAIAVATAYLLKIRREEKMLSALAGYDEYRKSVRALIPYVF
jgi:protein-S-isoprenylcysteine O-methyltransferase Ste14